MCGSVVRNNSHPRIDPHIDSMPSLFPQLRTHDIIRAPTYVPIYTSNSRHTPASIHILTHFPIHAPTYNVCHLPIHDTVQTLTQTPTYNIGPSLWKKRKFKNIAERRYGGNTVT